MKKRIYHLIILELLIVLGLTTAWEFWIEEFTFVMMMVTGSRLRSISGSIPKQNSVIVFARNVHSSYTRTYSMR
jgi:hydrogenase/urease accessory protein HupE